MPKDARWGTHRVNTRLLYTAPGCPEKGRREEFAAVSMGLPVVIVDRRHVSMKVQTLAAFGRSGHRPDAGRRELLIGRGSENSEGRRPAFDSAFMANCWVDDVT